MNSEGFTLSGLLGLALWLMGAATSNVMAQNEPGDVDEADLEEFSRPLPSDVVVRPDLKQVKQRVLVYREPARWPRVAAKKRISGCVLYAFSIDETGAVTSVDVVESSNEYFNQPGEDALYQYRFSPSESVDEAAGAHDDASESPVVTPPLPHRIQLVWKQRRRQLPDHPACD